MSGILNCTESRGEVIHQNNTLVQANAIITAFISFGGIIGNSLIIAVFFRKKSLRNVNNIFLVQLAAIDFTKAVGILIPKIYTQLARECTISAAYCPISGFISTVCFIHSALLLAAIGLVRYFKMLRSSSFDLIFASRRLLCYCLFLAFQTIILGMVPFLGGGLYRYSPYHGVCFTDWSAENKGFRITFYVYTIGICYITILFSYTKIYMKLRAHNTATMASLDSARSMPREMVNQSDTCPPGGVKGVYKVKTEKGGVEITPNSVSSVRSNSKMSREVGDVVLEEDQDEEKLKKEDEEIDEEEEFSNNLQYDANEDLENDDVNDEEKEPDAEEVMQKMEPQSSEDKNNSSNSERSGGCMNNAITKMKSRKKGSEKDFRSSRLYLNELKVTKIMFLIVIAYTVCWVPAFIINVVMFASQEEGQKGNSNEVQPNVLYLIITLVDLKVLINPMIYGIMNYQFRKEIKALICKMFDFYIN